MILAIEPAEENFLALSRNLRVNSIKNVFPTRIAAHRQEEEVFLQGESSNMFVTEEKKGQRVRGKPLDLIVRSLGIQNVDLVKTDVQGHEMSVLSGMCDLFQKRLVGLLVLEVHLKRGTSIDDVVSFMNSHDYSLVYKDTYLFDQPYLYFAPRWLGCSGQHLMIRLRPPEGERSLVKVTCLRVRIPFHMALGHTMACRGTFLTCLSQVHSALGHLWVLRRSSHYVVEVAEVSGNSRAEQHFCD